MVASAHSEDATAGGQVIDLMAALQASLGGKKAKPAGKASTSTVTELAEAKERKGVKRMTKVAAAPAAEPPAQATSRGRAKK